MMPRSANCACAPSLRRKFVQLLSPKRFLGTYLTGRCLLPSSSSSLAMLLQIRCAPGLCARPIHGLLCEHEAAAEALAPHQSRYVLSFPGIRAILLPQHVLFLVSCNRR